MATANTVGLGDTTGLYHGAQQINQGQLDRWNLVDDAELPGARKKWKVPIVQAKSPRHFDKDDAVAVPEMASKMVRVAESDARLASWQAIISTVMSPRTVITWAENTRTVR